MFSPENHHHEILICSFADRYCGIISRPFNQYQSKLAVICIN